MTDLDLDALAAVAEAATPGPWDEWHSDDGRVEVYVPNGTMSTETVLCNVDYDDCPECGRPSPADAAHIAAFDPPTVLALIAEVRHWKDHAHEAGEGFARVCQDYARVSARNAALRRQVAQLTTERDKALESARKLFVETRDLRIRAEAAEQERDEARANRDRLAHEVAALRRQVADLTAERDEALVEGASIGIHLRPQSVDSALAAQGEGIARAIEAMAAQFVTMARAMRLPFNEARRAKHAGYLEAADCARRAALDGPAPQPDECSECETTGRNCIEHRTPTPPTTDVEETQ
jgi:cell division protein FtsB